MAEILAPCGSPEALNAALRTGADAVYLGGESFSARQNASNFSYEELKKAVFDCHVRNVKLYLAINTMITDEQLEKCAKFIETACKLGIDGLITQDLALVEIVRCCCPNMEIHSSTQMTVHTPRGALTAKNLGFSRVVLSRELPYEIIAEISKLPLETEVFIHGALCMSVSGQCYMSAVIGSRSANRGLCAQPCRLPMSPVKGKEDYVLSLKDLCGIDFADRLENSGVSSLKIEGRMKRPEYVASAVNAYKNKSKHEDYDLSLLESVFSRSGFTDGYLKGKTGREMFGTRTKEDVAASSKALPRLHELYRKEYKRSKIKIHCSIEENKPIEITAADENGIKVSVVGDVAQTAINRSCDEEMLKKHLSKLGDTIYSLENLTADINGRPAVSASQLNSARRELMQKMDMARSEFFTHTVPFDGDKLFLDFPKRQRFSKPEIRISINSLRQLDLVDIQSLDMIIMPLSLAEKATEQSINIDKIAISMPRFTFNEKDDFDRLKKLKETGINKIMCTNIAHISMGKDLNMEIHTDFGFNIANSLALKSLAQMNVKDAIVSFELKASQINRLCSDMPIGIVAYGKLSLMLTANCPLKQSQGCDKCEKRLFDRTGREFPVKCSKNYGYVEILNSELLYTADKLNDFNVDFLRLDFYDETSERVRDIVSMYESGDSSGLEKITRGLYYRGVK
ncbi:MAG: U32 family peptidase [Ruminococcus sp.]|nr:U32 family peptidase [Ruminococcus sp.]